MATVPSIDMLPLIFRTTVPKTPEFVEMIDNMSKVEPIERDKFWSLLSTVASLDWIGASPILREAMVVGTPDVISVVDDMVWANTRNRRNQPIVLTIEMLDDALINHDD